MENTATVTIVEKEGGVIELALKFEPEIDMKNNPEGNLAQRCAINLVELFRDSQE